MNDNIMFISVASWEDRFRIGVERQLANKKPDFVLLYYYKEYNNWSKNNRKIVSAMCSKNKINSKVNELSFSDYKSSWLTIYDDFNKLISKYENIILDITTMPREAIWTLLYLSTDKGKKIKYIYNKPNNYSKTWLSRDPGRPRLVYKLGGASKLGFPTALLILTGFDKDRVKQLIRYFEPAYTLLGLQRGDQYKNSRMNQEKFIQLYKGKPNTYLFETDSYNEDHGYEIIKKEIKKYVKNYNVIISSLGPKPSSIALFRIHLDFPETGLVYAPSNEFNRKYSTGIKENPIFKGFYYK